MLELPSAANVLEGALKRRFPRAVFDCGLMATLPLLVDLVAAPGDLAAISAMGAGSRDLIGLFIIKEALIKSHVRWVQLCQFSVGSVSLVQA